MTKQILKKRVVKRSATLLFVFKKILSFARKFYENSLNSIGDQLQPIIAIPDVVVNLDTNAVTIGESTSRVDG